MGVPHSVGIVGGHHVGVGQLGDRLDFAVEAVDGIVMAEPVGADDFQGDNALHQAMAGLEDLAHAPFAEPLQQEILTQDQGPAVAAQQLVGLVRRQPAALHQLSRQRLRVRETVP